MPLPSMNPVLLSQLISTLQKVLTERGDMPIMTEGKTDPIVVVEDATVLISTASHYTL